MTKKVGELSACYGHNSKEVRLGGGGGRQWFSIVYRGDCIQINPKQLRQLFLIAIEVWGREYMIKVLNGEEYA